MFNPGGGDLNRLPLDDGPGDPSKLDSDDLLQGGSAVVIAGNVGGGIIFDAKPADTNPSNNDEDGDGMPDSTEGTAAITSFGAAPAVVIGSATQDMTIGAVAGSTFGHGIVNKGTITGDGVYQGIGSTGMSIGGLGQAHHRCRRRHQRGYDHCQGRHGGRDRASHRRRTTAPQIVNLGTISAQGGGADRRRRRQS